MDQGGGESDLQQTLSLTLCIECRPDSGDQTRIKRGGTPLPRKALPLPHRLSVSPYYESRSPSLCLYSLRLNPHRQVGRKLIYARSFPSSHFGY